MVLLLALNPYKRNACVLDVSSKFLGNLGSLLRQNLSGGCINHILSQNVTYDTVLKVKLFIEFITTYLCQIVAARIEEHAV